MDEQKETQESPQWKPRPKWQILLGRIGLALFLLFLVLYYIVIFQGGR